MWVFTLDGFYSVVQKDRDKGTEKVHVRSRNRHDLERFIQRMNIQDKVIETPNADYPFRVISTRWIWGEYLEQMAKMITYDNFKHEIEIQDGMARAHIYLRVWHGLRDLMEHAKKSEDFKQ
jgi:hypothetical protein